MDGDIDEQAEKAETVIAWARDEFGETVVEAHREDQRERARDAWRDEIKAAHERRENRLFADAPPETYNGWQQIPTSHDHVEVAYQACNYGTPSVVAVFETAEGDLDAAEFTVDKWTAANADPREAQWNRPVTIHGENVWSDLKDHMDTFDGEPLESENQAAAPVSA